LARPIVLIPHLFWLVDAIKFLKGLFTLPLVRHLDPTLGSLSWHFDKLDILVSLGKHLPLNFIIDSSS
jgi:hypothetical protein